MVDGGGLLFKTLGLIKTRLPVAFQLLDPPEKIESGLKHGTWIFAMHNRDERLPVPDERIRGDCFGRNDRTLRIEEQMAEERSWRPEQRGQQSGPKNKMGQ